MKYVRVDLENNNTILEISKTPIQNLLSNESQGSTTFDFPTSRPPYYYTMDTGGTIALNNEDVISEILYGLPYKIYHYMNNQELKEYYRPPLDFDYNVLGLSKKRTFSKGELDKIEYYGYLDSGGTYQDLILTEYRTFYRKDRMVYKRKLDIEWYLDDGTTGATKTTYKYYSPEESLKLGERRRRNVISDLKIASIGLLQQVSGLTQIEATMTGLGFLGIVTTEITKYIEGVEQPLKDKVLNCNEDGCEWLDLEIPNTGGITVRQYLYSSIDIDYSDKLG